MLAALVLLTGMAGATGVRVALRPPTSRLARGVVVVWLSTGRIERLSEPGTYDLEFACSHVEDATERLRVEITARAAPEFDAGQYRRCDAAEVPDMAAAQAGVAVSFQDEFARRYITAQDRPLPVRLPDGREVPVSHAFVTTGGLVCMLPEGSASLEPALALMQGDRLHVLGRAYPAPGSATWVVVDWLGFSEPTAGPDEPPWQVRALWDEEELLSVMRPGDYSLRPPCRHKERARARIGLRLRTFPLVDLKVGDAEVTAELAATPQARSYGVQGRDGLPPGHGMLFFWERPLRARFVMKSVSFPLSVAFIRADGIITDIEHMEPGDQVGVVSSVPVNYVLEMRRGWFSEHGVREGGRVVVP
ncbi:MAG: DUF192 domain-containing protein [Candidatus Brocadiia bacterium]